MWVVFYKEFLLLNLVKKSIFLKSGLIFLFCVDFYIYKNLYKIGMLNYFLRKYFFLLNLVVRIFYKG